MSNERPQQPPQKRIDREKPARRSIWLVSLTALLIAIIALLLSQCSIRPFSESTPTATSTPCPVPSAGAAGVDGLSAFELWKAVGNTGTLQDFLDSLVGDPGPAGEDGKVVYIGNDGQTGPAGDEGLSAYQLWLDNGHTGTEQDFLDSLLGEAGADGVMGPEGPSAYDVWVATGGDGDETDFLRSLVGPAGADGESGSDGLSAYDLWLVEGGIGDEAFFLSTLVGPAGADGVDGADGVCAPGETGATGPAGADGLPGANGADGLSAYDLWVLAGNGGTVDEFLTSLVGANGADGAPGATGPQGPAGTGGLGDVGSFFDLTTQGWDSSPEVSKQVNTAFPIYLSDSDPSVTDGVTVLHGNGDEVSLKSHITFSRSGIYNIAFSAQLHRTQGGSTATTSFWLRKNGVDVPATNTDVTLQAGAGKLVAAWNFFVPVTCSTVVYVTTCDQYQLMWSYADLHINIWFEDVQSNPTRPSTPSVIVTVNQVQ